MIVTRSEWSVLLKERLGTRGDNRAREEAIRERWNGLRMWNERG